MLIVGEGNEDMHHGSAGLRYGKLVHEREHEKKSQSTQE
jgi:hypothetical protein